jgi:hypothetical protein
VIPVNICVNETVVGRSIFDVYGNSTPYTLFTTAYTTPSPETDAESSLSVADTCTADGEIAGVINVLFKIVSEPEFGIVNVDVVALAPEGAGPVGPINDILACQPVAISRVYNVPSFVSNIRSQLATSVGRVSPSLTLYMGCVPAVLSIK